MNNNLKLYKIKINTILNKDPQPCYICGMHSNFSKIFIEPNVDDLNWYFDLLGSNKFLKYVSVFWLCPYHYDTVIDSTKFNKMIDDKSLNTNELNNYRSLITKIRRTNRKFRRLIFKVKFKLIVEQWICNVLRSILNFKK